MKHIFLKAIDDEMLIEDLKKVFSNEWLRPDVIEQDGLSCTMLGDGLASLLLTDGFNVDVFESDKPKFDIPPHEYAGYTMPIPAPHPDPEVEAKARVSSDIAFGREIILDYLTENKMMELPTSISIAQLQKLASVKMLLETGALAAARDVLMLTEADEVFTAERKQKFIDKLNLKLNDLS